MTIGGRTDPEALVQAMTVICDLVLPVIQQGFFEPFAVTTLRLIGERGIPVSSQLNKCVGQSK